MPESVVTPQAMSFIAIPTLVGSPPGWPVISMMPDMPFEVRETRLEAGDAAEPEGPERIGREDLSGELAGVRRT